MTSFIVKVICARCRKQVHSQDAHDTTIVHLSDTPATQHDCHKENPVKTTTKVKLDAHGLYVKTGGYIFRPVLCKHWYPVIQPAALGSLAKRTADERRKDPYTYAPDPDLFKDGEAVAARHVGGTPYARVQTGDGKRKALWWSHGDYQFAGKARSEDCWNPVPLNER